MEINKSPLPSQHLQVSCTLAEAGVDWAPTSEERLAPGQMGREGIAWWEAGLRARITKDQQPCTGPASF